MQLAQLATIWLVATLYVVEPTTALRMLKNAAIESPLLTSTTSTGGTSSGLHQGAGLFSTGAVPSLPTIPGLPKIPSLPIFGVQNQPSSARQFLGPPAGSVNVQSIAAPGQGTLTTRASLVPGFPEIDFIGHPRLRVGDVGADRYPFNVVGNMANGCTGTLVGPCHVLTAGHCVYSHERNEFSKQLSFFPARNGKSDGPPKPWKDYRVSPGWLQFEDYNADYAIVSLKEKVGTELGWMGFGYNLQEEVVGLNMAGYPIDQPTGTMWFDYCDNVKFDYNGEKIIRHGCQVVEGNSGSPMWVFDKTTGFREIRAVHNGARITNSGNIPYASVINPAVATELKSWINQLQC